MRIVNKNTNGTRTRYMGERELMQELTPASENYGKVVVGTDGTGEGELILANDADVLEVQSVLGTGSNVRYDKKLGSLDVIDRVFVNGDLTSIIYTGDNDTDMYYRDVLVYTNGDLTAVKHFYSTIDLVTVSATTTFSYTNNEITSTTYTEV